VTPAPIVGAGEAKEAHARNRRTPPDAIERILALVRWTGLALLVLGATDVALTWLPTGFGSREWEFATVTASFNGMPVILLGLVLVVATAGWEERRWWSLGAGLVAAAFVLFALGAIALWAGSVPLALGSVEGLALVGLKKAIFKTTLQGVVLPVIFGAIAYQGLKGSRSPEA
jgi:hypothetical protein